MRSPAYRQGWQAWKKVGRKEDLHCNDVWSGDEPIKDYVNYLFPFYSEFAMRSLPDMENLKKFIPEKELWPLGPSLSYHGSQNVTMKRCLYYIKEILGDIEIKTLEEFVLATQKVHAFGFKYAIEHFRRSKPKTSGCIFWCYNEPYPSTHSVIDWYLRPKLVYYAVKNAYSPLLINLEYLMKTWKKGEVFEANLWIINDYQRSFKNCRAKVRIIDQNGKSLEEISLHVDILQGSAKNIKKINWAVPDNLDNEFILKLNFRNGEDLIISQNEYIFRCVEGDDISSKKMIK